MVKAGDKETALTSKGVLEHRVVFEDVASSKGTQSSVLWKAEEDGPRALALSPI